MAKGMIAERESLLQHSALHIPESIKHSVNFSHEKSQDKNYPPVRSLVTFSKEL
jgi:hypothetical protein